MTPAIDAVLAATDHYEVLGVDRTVDDSTLRKAYLRRSVQVHPDKNDDPRATLAFQRVALAWQVLSDDSKRVRYDATGCQDSMDDIDDDKYAAHGTSSGGTSNARCRGPQQPPSFQEALFMFATVTNMMSGGNSTMAGDIAQTLYWADQILQADRSVGTENSDMQQKANVAMAIGSSLRVVSAAASMLGMRESAAKLEQTANMTQILAIGAKITDAVKDTPGVQQVLEQAGKQFESLKGNLRPEHVNKIRDSISSLQGMLHKS